MTSILTPQGPGSSATQIRPFTKGPGSALMEGVEPINYESGSGDAGIYAEEVTVEDLGQVHQSSPRNNTTVRTTASASQIGNMMEEVNLGTDDNEGEAVGNYDSYDEDSNERPLERWAPLGAAAPVSEAAGEECSYGELSHLSEKDKLRILEEEQEQLNSSLMCLTSHFAQVQFRLKQIVDAPTEQKEDLLKELEEFAFKGIPDARGSAIEHHYDNDDMSESEVNSKIAEQREKQTELIQQLKSQLEDLETYAYETGESDLPTNQVIEKQGAMIDQLKQKLNLDLEEFERLSPEDLRNVVDHAIGTIVNPAKVKEKMVEQLKTQITDLERFISFLQGEAQTPGPLGDKHCSCSVHKHGGSATSHARNTLSGHSRHRTESESQHRACLQDSDVEFVETLEWAERVKTFREQTLDIMKKTLTVLQIFAISQFGCGGRDFQKNVLKRTTKGNHWGDLRAKLELCIDNVIRLQAEAEKQEVQESDYTSDSEESPVIQCNQELTAAVRKELAPAIRDLLQHGLMEVGQSTSLVPFGCFPSRSRESRAPKMMHAWDLFVKFYEMKHGKEYNEQPARKLSQSFSLDVVGGRAVTAKQNLLGAIEEVTSSHVPLKRSEDSQFKAFVCTALNKKGLVKWIRMVLRTNSLMEYYYQPWSYVVKTGFDDALVSLDRLTKVHFSLPVDMAVRPFTNIKDAF